MSTKETRGQNLRAGANVGLGIDKNFDDRIRIYNRNLRVKSFRVANNNPIKLRDTEKEFFSDSDCIINLCYICGIPYLEISSRLDRSKDKPINLIPMSNISYMTLIEDNEPGS